MCMSVVNMQDSVQLRALWHQLQEAETGVEMQTHRIRLRTHQNCIMGRDLVDWLIRNDKAVKRQGMFWCDNFRLFLLLSL